MKVLLIGIALCFALVQLGCSGSHAGTTVPEPEVEVLDSSVPQVIGKLLPVLKDVSGSQNDDQLKELFPDIADAIMRRAGSIDGAEATVFANGGRPIWRESGQKFLWGAPPGFKEFDENKILANAPKSVTTFAQNKKEYLDRARQKYDREKNRLTAEYYERIHRALEQLQEYLLQKPLAEPDCTKFKSLASRLEKDAVNNGLVLTDGWPDCANESAENIKPARIEGKLIILQLTRKIDTQADDEAFLSREKFLHALFPSARIFPAYRAKEAIEALFK